MEVDGKAVEESVANDAESGRTPDYVSQQTFNFTFLDPPATERSQSQPAVDPRKSDSNDLPQDVDQEQQGSPVKKDDIRDQSLSPSCQQSSSEGSSISQPSQGRPVSVPVGVPVLQLSKMTPSHDDSHNASEEEQSPDAAEEPVQNPAGGASVVSHSLSESSWESDEPDARVEVSVCTSQQVDQDDVAPLVHKAEACAVQLGERSPKRSPLSSQGKHEPCSPGQMNETCKGMMMGRHASDSLPDHHFALFHQVCMLLGPKSTPFDAQNAPSNKIEAHSETSCLLAHADFRCKSAVLALPSSGECQHKFLAFCTSAAHMLWC